MRERVVKVGRPTPLTCIVSEPQLTDTNKPAVIILNSGIMHHIGTCRISVKLARSLAENGFLALRMDFSGLGDSEPRTGTQSFTESAPKEVAEVMDYMQKTKGIKRFILYGLCSGADASYETAKVDERVVGMCQIDSYAYRTPDFYIRRAIQHYLPRLAKLDVWGRYVKRISQSIYKKLLRKTESTTKEGDEFIELPSYIRVFPTREEVKAGLAQLVDRNVQMYNIFTGDMSRTINSHKQYSKSFIGLDFKGTLKVDYLPDCSHIIAEPDNQQNVVSEITKWILNNSCFNIQDHCCPINRNKKGLNLNKLVQWRCKQTL